MFWPIFARGPRLKTFKTFKAFKTLRKKVLEASLILLKESTLPMFGYPNLNAGLEFGYPSLDAGVDSFKNIREISRRFLSWLRLWRQVKFRKNLHKYLSSSLLIRRLIGQWRWGSWGFRPKATSKNRLKHFIPILSRMPTGNSYESVSHE